MWTQYLDLQLSLEPKKIQHRKVTNQNSRSSAQDPVGCGWREGFIKQSKSLINDGVASILVVVESGLILVKPKAPKRVGDQPHDPVGCGLRESLALLQPSARNPAVVVSETQTGLGLQEGPEGKSNRTLQENVVGWIIVKMANKIAFRLLLQYTGEVCGGEMGPLEVGILPSSLATQPHYQADFLILTGSIWWQQTQGATLPNPKVITGFIGNINPLNPFKKRRMKKESQNRNIPSVIIKKING